VDEGHKLPSRGVAMGDHPRLCLARLIGARSTARRYCLFGRSDGRERLADRLDVAPRQVDEYDWAVRSCLDRLLNELVLCSWPGERYPDRYPGGGTRAIVTEVEIE